MSCPQAPNTLLDPKQYQIYLDGEGDRYVLTMDKRVMWFALKLGETPRLVILSTENLRHMQLIGRATLDSRA